MNGLNITQADVREARKAMAGIREAQEMVQVLKACKLECTEDDERCQQMQGFLTDFLELFGPRFPKA